MLKFWNQSDLVKRSDYVSFQKTVDAIVVPSDVGRIPRKIETWFLVLLQTSSKTGLHYFPFHHFMEF